VYTAYNPTWATSLSLRVSDVILGVFLFLCGRGGTWEAQKEPGERKWHMTRSHTFVYRLSTTCFGRLNHNDASDTEDCQELLDNRLRCRDLVVSSRSFWWFVQQDWQRHSCIGAQDQSSLCTWLGHATKLISSEHISKSKNMYEIRGDLGIMHRVWLHDSVM
jgi:hypothetical protein